MKFKIIHENKQTKKENKLRENFIWICPTNINL